MSYCTLADMIARFGEQELIALTDRMDDNGEFAGVVNEAALAEAIADAQAEIDSFLTARYRLPLVQVPPILKRVACNMARYYLHDDSELDTVKERYQWAIAFLKGVAKGERSLGIVEPQDSEDAESATDSATTNSAEIVSDGHVFSRDDTSFI